MPRTEHLVNFVAYIQRLKWLIVPLDIHLTLVLKLCEIAPDPYGGGFLNPESLYPPPIQGAGAYVDAYGRPLVQMAVGPAGEGMTPYSRSNGLAVSGAILGAAAPGAGSAAVSGEAHDPSLAHG